MEFTVKDFRNSITIATTSTETAAIRAGRKHEREISKMGGCAEGFNVYDGAGRMIRRQTCDNFGNHWKEA